MYLKVMLTLLVIVEAAAAAAVWRAARPEPGATYYSDGEVAAGLNRRAGAVRMRGVPLGEAVQRLASATGTRVAFEPGAAESIGWSLEDRIDLELHDPRLSAAFAVLLPAPLEACAEGDGTIRIARREHGWDGQVVRAYDVGTIVDVLARGGDPAERAEAVGLIEEILRESTIYVESIPTGSVYGVGDTVVVVHVEALHRRVERLLAELRAAGQEFDRR